MSAGTILGGLMGEIKHHPWTTFTALIALAGVTVMFPQYLSAGELSRKVASIEATQIEQIKQTLENRLASLRSALFDIESRISDIRDRGDAPDQVYWNELKRLREEIDRVERDLAEF